MDLILKKLLIRLPLFLLYNADLIAPGSFFKEQIMIFAVLIERCFRIGNLLCIA